ncbi:MAG TPA: hypothetical protein PL125_02950 [Candidatus Omnitrophota bacterium]|nr:hypothetical protein [Candidatus Omnitrophota bacterium]
MKRFLWVFLAMLLFWAALGNFIFNQYRLHDSFKETRQQLMLIAANAALGIDARELMEIPLQESGDNSLAYQAVSDKLDIIKQTNPSLKYVYVMTTTDQLGILQYMADADPAPQIITAKCRRALPGVQYDGRAFPEMLKAYNGPAADQSITSDEWGIFISGYAPIRDANGKSIAILGADIDAAGISLLQKNVRVSILLAIAASFMFLISLFGILIFRSPDRI